MTENRDTMKSNTLAKYRNEKTEVDGIVFDSKKEAGRWMELKMLEELGKIQGLQRQGKIELVAGVVLDGRKKPPVRYYYDFRYLEGNQEIIEDCKSTITRKNPVYRLKRHLLKALYKIEIRET